MPNQDLVNRVELHFSKEGLTEDEVDAKIGKHVRFFGRNFKCVVVAELLETENKVHMTLTEGIG